MSVADFRRELFELSAKYGRSINDAEHCDAIEALYIAARELALDPYRGETCPELAGTQEEHRTPPGWQLVPIAPTQAILDEMPRLGCGYRCTMEGSPDEPSDAWGAMLAAARAGGEQQ